MKDKSFKLMKELLLEQAQGAGTLIQEEIDLAKELFCEINGYSLERFEELYKEAWEHLYTLYPNGIECNEWKTFRVQYAMLIDGIKYALEEEIAGSQSKDR